MAFALQKLLRYFNGTFISAFFLSSLPILPDIFVLNLNKALLLLSIEKSLVASLLFKAGSSL